MHIVFVFVVVVVEVSLNTFLCLKNVDDKNFELDDHNEQKSG